MNLRQLAVAASVLTAACSPHLPGGPASVAAPTVGPQAVSGLSATADLTALAGWVQSVRTGNLCASSYPLTLGDAATAGFGEVMAAAFPAGPGTDRLFAFRPVEGRGEMDGHGEGFVEVAEIEVDLRVAVTVTDAGGATIFDGEIEGAGRGRHAEALACMAVERASKAAGADALEDLMRAFVADVLSRPYVRG